MLDQAPSSGLSDNVGCRASQSSTFGERDLEKIARTTLGHYSELAQQFWEGTKDHDVSQNRDALLRHLVGTPPFKILDFGCGPGRDLMAFKKLGHEPVGLDGTKEFCDMARSYTGCPVLHQNFLKLDLPSAAFDGVFANASMFHIPRQELPRILRQLAVALKPQGVLMCSNPRGQDEEGWFSGDRFGAYLTFESWCSTVESCGFELLEHYYRPPGKPRHEQPWLVTVWRRQKT